MTSGEADTRAEALRLDEALPDLDWTELPPGTEKTWHEAPSGRLAMIALGDPSAPRVVLVPGVTGSKEDFILMMPLLARAGYRVESFDMAGQYESGEAGPENLVPPRRHYDHDLFVNDLVSVLEAGSAPVHVLGYSFAGTVSQIAFARRPELFASLTLKRLGPITGVTTGGVGAALMIWGVKNNFTKVPPGRLAFVRHRFAYTRRQSVRDIITLMKKSPDLRDTLRDAPIPKLVAVGEHDLWPLSLHRELAESIGAQLAVYVTGHSPCETAPHQLVLDLLQTYESAAG